MKKFLAAVIVSSFFSSIAFAAGSTGMNTVTTNINVRSTPEIANNIIDHLSTGQQVKVIKVVGEWCQIDYNNHKEAYAFCNYLNLITQPQPPVQQPTTQQSIPPSTLTSDCRTPIQNFGGIEVAQGEMKTITVKVCAGMRYLACTQNPTGNPDLYGAVTLPTTDIFSQKSTDGTMDDGNGNQIPRADCIWFEPRQDGKYYVGVYGAAPESKTNLWVSGSRKQFVPVGFEKQLSWFSDSCATLTTRGYGPFNRAWGNDGNADRPFYEGYGNYIHGGVDIACPANTPIKAMCDGIITDSNDAGGDWGWHTVLDCKKTESTISIAYIHLNQESVLPVGTSVTEGQVIGTVFPLNSPGEVEHIHLTACNQSHDDCEAAGFQPERGAARRTEWWGASQFWFDMDWHSNPNLYQSFPLSR